MLDLFLTSPIHNCKENGGVHKKVGSLQIEAGGQGDCGDNYYCCRCDIQEMKVKNLSYLQVAFDY